MIDQDIVLAKAGSVRRHLNRIKKNIDISLQTFLDDINVQDIILFNIQLAVQNCIDIAAHIISEEDMGVAGSTNEMFYLLEENGYLEKQLTEKMVKAVAFRNLIVHEYARIDIKRVFDVAKDDINDLEQFLKAVIKK